MSDSDGMVFTLDEPHRLIRASAGTGKTYALSSRYLLLLMAGMPVGEILATTFTRKAAGEILGRILTRLAKGAVDQEAADRLLVDLGNPSLQVGGGVPGVGGIPGVLRGVCGQLNRVGVSTIDAFFARILQGFHHELGLPMDLAMAEATQPSVVAIRQQAIEKMLADQAEREDGQGFQTLVDLLRRVHFDQAKRSVTQSIDAIVTELHDVYLTAPDAAAWGQVEVEGALLEGQALERAMEAMSLLAETMPENKNKSKPKRWVDSYTQMIDVLNQGQWKDFLKLTLVKQIHEHGGGKYDKKEIPEQWVNVIDPMIQHAQAAILLEYLWANLAAYKLVEGIDENYRAMMLERGMMLFSEATHRLAGALPALPDVQFRLDAQLRHVLLDEFQDTSLEQWAVLRPMCEEVVAEGLSDRSFFCVGDMKQAIYGWRGGQAALFDQVEDDLQLPDAAMASMVKSYRSSAVVLGAVNTVFSQIAEIDLFDLQWRSDRNWTVDSPWDAIGETVRRWAARFELHEAARDLPGYVVMRETPPPPPAPPPEERDGRYKGSWDRDDDAFDEDDDEGAAVSKDDPHYGEVVRTVVDLCRQHPTRTIGVLVRRNAVLRLLLNALNDAGVEASGEGGSLLTDHAMVNAVLSAVHWLDHPGDTVAAYYWMASPVGRVVLGDRWAAGTERAKREAWTYWREVLQRDGLAAMLGGWVRGMREMQKVQNEERTETRGEKAGGGGGVDGRGWVRLGQLVRLAERWERESGSGGSGGGDVASQLRPSGFVGYVKVKPMEGGGGAGGGAGGASRVKVMTVHQAKGLEFDVVVLPELDGGLDRQWSGMVQVLREDVEGKALGEVRAVYRRANKGIRSLSPTMTAAYEQTAASRMNDALSALYVAMTRARHALHLLVKPTEVTKKGELAKAGVGDLSFAAILRHAMGVLNENGDGEGVSGEVLWESGEVDWDRAGELDDERVVEERAEEGVDDRRLVVLSRQAKVKSAMGVEGGEMMEDGVSPSMLAAGGRVDVADVLQSRKDGEGDGRAFGSAVHALMEGVGFVDEGLPTGADLLAGVVVDDDVLIDEKVVGVVERYLRGVEVQRVLSRDGADELWREKRFVLREADGTLLSGMLDRVVLWRGEDGHFERARVIDFKTDRVVGDDGVVDEAVLAEKVERYGLQMEAYRRAVVGLTGLDAARVEVGLLFLQGDRWVGV